jgi:hypothetical protein
MRENFSIVLRFTNKFIYKDQNYTEEFDTIEEHSDIIKKNGYVWWGKFGRKLGQQKVDSIMTTLSRNLDVFLYLFSEDKCYKARLGFITNEINSVNTKLIPSYYREFANEHCGTYFKITGIREADYSYNLQNLKLLSNPIKGSLMKGFSSQQSYFFVE